MEPTTASANPEQVYRERAGRYAAREQALKRRDRQMGNARGATFFAAGICIYFALTSETNQSGWYIAGGAFTVAFMALVGYHEWVIYDLVRHAELRRINEQLIARLFRRWSDVPCAAVDVPNEHVAVANDLDLFGHASVFQFLNQANTPMGQELLRDWLLVPAEPDEIRRRQEAVAELAPLVDLREQLNLRGRMLATSRSGPSLFVDWAENRPSLARRPWLKWLSRILPLIIAVFLVLTATGVLTRVVGLGSIMLLVLLNFLLTVVFAGTIHDIFQRVSSNGSELGHYWAMFNLLHQTQFTSTRMRALAAEVTNQDGNVLSGLRSLRRIMRLARVQRSAFTFFLVYVPCQALGLWDFHVVALLERWQQRYGPHARCWFEAIGEFEALASLASIKHDYPHWAMPKIDPSAERIVAQQLGHPLLADEVRVGNDVEIGPPGTLLLVTGSNMSGKSTLLRSVGVNVMLAQAGSVVCAEQMTMPPVTVTSSMRIRDSLEEGVSFYLAELKRLKQIVDLSREFKQRSDRRLLYLLDEILLGTNSRERHIAVVKVLTHLIEHQSMGAVTTHDLELAEMEPLASGCQPVHFRETLANGRMTFDYRMRPGVATTTNALKLLEMVGLGDESE